MAQTKYKMPGHIKQATVWLCRGYYDALEHTGESAHASRLVRAVDAALSGIASDIDNFELKEKLRKAIWESTLNGREYPYEVWDLPSIYRDDFYERKRKFIKEIAVNMGIIKQGG